MGTDRRCTRPGHQVSVGCRYQPETTAAGAAGRGYSVAVRVAFVGKGGAGKSSAAGTFARLLAGTGAQVLALDSDPMPGLAFSLGVPSRDTGIPDEAVEEYVDGGRARYRLRPGLGAADVVERYAVRGPDGVRLLQLGKARGPRWANARPHAAFQQVVDELPATGWSVVGDLPAGTRQPFMTWARYASLVVVVAEPSAASVLTARRLARLRTAGPGSRVVAVATKTRGPEDAARVARGSGLPLVGVLPLDPAVEEADRTGRAVLDSAPGSAYVEAVRALVSAVALEEAG
jgi:CO dehydrogenase maturation factor